MRFTILAYGTRGDVQPYVALGVALQRAGHTVRLAAPAVFHDLVAGYGLAFHGLPGDPADLMLQVADGASANLVSQSVVVLRHTLPLARQMVDSVQKACQGAEAIVHSMLMTVIGHQMAVARGVPDFSALIFLVFCPTSAFPVPTLAPGKHRARNRLSHVAFTQLFWQMNRLAYAYLRRGNHDLPPLSGWPLDRSLDRPTPILYGLSSQIVPRPDDWGPDTHLTGYWTMPPPAGWRPPPEVEAFLAAGPPPVLVSFGSLMTRRVEQLTEVVLGALARTGQRAVLVRGWGGIGQRALPPQILALDSVPFEWLFPRMAALVHHGGVGTTATGLRAGVPAVIVPFTADQPFWGRQVARLGVGPAPIPPKKLSVDRLAAAIEAALGDGAMRQRAADLGERLRAEDGAGRAVEILEAYLARAG
ncbi:MAG: glycosyltransferase [Anaerolineae bacterium]|jgi:UDP:flavonoid glycosyltransferase YjiC (YdhE family)